MLNFIQKEKLLSLVASQCVTDEHISNYLQGLSYEAWKVDKDLEVDVYEEIEVYIEAWKKENYVLLRASCYPPMAMFADAWVNGDEDGMEEYRQKCLDVKARFPK